MTTPPRPSASSLGGRSAAGLRREYVDGPFGQIHVLRAGVPGQGRRPLVCFHLTPGSGRMYDALLREMGTDRFVLAPDTPGYGASEPPPTVPTIHDYARAMVAVLDHYDIASVDLLGYHTGSKVAVELALTLPDRVHAIASGVGSGVHASRAREQQERHLATPRPLDENGQHLVEQFRELVRWRPQGTPLSLIQQEFAEQQRAGERAHWGTWRPSPTSTPNTCPGCSRTSCCCALRKTWRHRRCVRGA